MISTLNWRWTSDNGHGRKELTRLSIGNAIIFRGNVVPLGKSQMSSRPEAAVQKPASTISWWTANPRSRSVRTSVGKRQKIGNVCAHSTSAIYCFNCRIRLVLQRNVPTISNDVQHPMSITCSQKRMFVLSKSAYVDHSEIRAAEVSRVLEKK